MKYVIVCSYDLFKYVLNLIIVSFQDYENLWNFKDKKV